MFIKKSDSPPRAQPTSRVTTGSTFSVLGADMVIKGDIAASTDLHIDGRVEGDIACSTLVQGERSEVTGGITAECARLSGSVHGAISVRELVILGSARIHGDVHYDSLTIEQGAQVEGRFAPRQVTASEESEPLLTLASSAT